MIYSGWGVGDVRHAAGYDFDGGWISEAVSTGLCFVQP